MELRASSSFSKKKMKEKRETYWGSKEEKAVVDYIKSDSLSEMHKIYTKHLHQPFLHLVGGVIGKYKFNYDTQTNMVTQAMAKVYDVLNNSRTDGKYYDPNSGSTAYSYFTVTVKHHLVYMSRSEDKRQDQAQSESVEDVEWLVNELSDEYSNSNRGLYADQLKGTIDHIFDHFDHYFRTKGDQFVVNQLLNDKERLIEYRNIKAMNADLMEVYKSELPNGDDLTEEQLMWKYYNIRMKLSQIHNYIKWCHLNDKQIIVFPNLGDLKNFKTNHKKITESESV